jgi:hypothetical protein
MSVVIVCQGIAGRVHTRAGVLPPVGQYLASYDPEANDGQGEVVWTAKLAGAMVFPTAVEAIQCWGTVPVTRPVRADGKPNRPLTAFTIATETVPPAAFGGPSCQ